MNAAPSRSRRLALTLARHAAWMLPSAPSSWAQAMRHELDYIADDSAALRWAFGCMPNAGRLNHPRCSRARAASLAPMTMVRWAASTRHASQA